MRKYQQRQILELLNTIKQAQSERLYADCQDGAMVVGEFIESIAGEGVLTVALLEDYCELLYRASIGEIGERQLDKQIVQIENSLKSELKPDKTEIAFLSYKASMSDSIESIYLAAKDDPSCDAYWIPVPYYDVNADGTFGAMHYEGTDYYDETIECTDWREYDIEARHPDVIFTFNPYDAGNYVTRVHPNFYCERLRAHTDLLVYVPYFVCAGDIQEHFCTVAGCVYAHKIVLQSKKIRDIYIRVYKKAYGGKFGRAEDKFVALGSPKLDKMINVKREDYALPRKWKDLIEGKKVVLYNTTVAAILLSNDQYLKKLRDVLNTFHGRNDIALLWRPHPLISATYAGMRPQLLCKYEQIVEDYKNEEWGIYDDTPDHQRAMAWSDACFCDGGSIVPMYQVKGKPMMISGVNVLHEEPVFMPSCIYVLDEHIWVLLRGTNALCKMSKSKWELEFVGSFPDEANFLMDDILPFYLKPTHINGVIYFPPQLAKEIASYSIEDNLFDKVQFNKVGKDFCEAVSYESYVFLVPRHYPGILRLDIVSRQIVCFSDWVNSLNTVISDTNDAYTFFPTTVGNSIMIAVCGANAVVEFNMKTFHSNVYEVGKKGAQYSGICYDGENYWLSPRHNNPAIKWNKQTGEVKEFGEFICVDEDIKFSYLPCAFCGGYVWMLPYASAHAVKIDARTEEVSIAEEFELSNQKEVGQSNVKYHFAQVFGSSIYAFNEQSKTLIEYDCEKKERREEKIEYPPEAMAKIEPLMASKFLAGTNSEEAGVYCYYENKHLNLNNFLNYLTLYGDNDEAAEINRIQAERARAKNENADGTAGKAIYDYIKAIVFY